MSLPETAPLDLPDGEVPLAPGVVVSATVRKDILWIHYEGSPEALIAARVCTPEMLVAPEGLDPYGARGRRTASFKGVDSCGRSFNLRYHFKYRRGRPRAVRSAWVSYRDLAWQTALTLPGAREAIARDLERARLIEEQNRRDAQMARRGHLRLVVDNTREMRS